MAADTPQLVDLSEGAKSISGQRDPEDYAGGTPKKLRKLLLSAKSVTRLPLHFVLTEELLQPQRG